MRSTSGCLFSVVQIGECNQGGRAMTWAGVFEGFQIAATVAPLGTTVVAVSAALAAWRSITVQGRISRTRATIDFFLKTEMEPHLIALYQAFRKQRNKLDAMREEGFRDGVDYWKLVEFLNICELLAVGIERKAFSDQVAWDFWRDILPDCREISKILREIDQGTEDEGTLVTYVALERLCEKWELRARA